MKHRLIDMIIVHGSSTRLSLNFTTFDIRYHHIYVNGYDDIGYHYVIERNGSIIKGRPDSVIGAHHYGYNRTSIGVCLIGGVDEHDIVENNYTTSQLNSLMVLLNDLLKQYPEAKIFGRCDLDSHTKNPGINVVKMFNNYNH